MWWNRDPLATPFWKVAAGGFMPPIGQAMPAGLLARFSATEALAQLLQALRFLAPLSMLTEVRQVLTRSGTWVKPLALAVLDDRSRLACHVQWYLDETTESLVHGLSQALQRRGLPRSLMSGNGSAMVAQEFTAGLHALGIVHQPTLPYSPQMNGKQEVFWSQLEGRLMAMLEGVAELTLDLLNTATHAWVEHESQRREHAELAPAARSVRSRSRTRHRRSRAWRRCCAN